MARLKIRKRIFVGCEGASERGYVRWLQEVANSAGLWLAFDAQLANGGDPLAVVEKSAKILKRRERSAGKFAAKAVLLDSDRVGDAPQRDQRIGALAAKHDFAIIWQEFDHEALLLRHLEGCDGLRPPRGRSDARLRQVWPGYVKPATGQDLARKLGHFELARALAVEPELAGFLGSLGFLDIP